PLYLTFSSSHTHRHPRTLHSFPTRRSSDLTQAELDAYKLLGGVPSDIGIGDARFKDLNGDGKISIYGDTPGDDGDVVNLGNTARSEEHTSELQSRSDLVCRLLLEKKKFTAP